MSTVSAGGPRRRRSLASGLPVALLVLLAAGCGGGGGEEGPAEDAVRAKLQAAADRFDELRSFRGSVLVEVAEDSGDEPSPVACVAVAGERRQPGDADDRADLRVYEGDCGASPDVEVIAIGRELWSTLPDGRWHASRVAPALVGQLTEDQMEFDELMAAATDLQPVAGVPRTYQFSAPASAFAQTEDVGDVDLDLEATLDREGYLRELVAAFEVDGAQGEIEVTYDQFGRAGPIEPPPRRDVVGPVTRISTEAELEGLITLSGLGPIS